MNFEKWVKSIQTAGYNGAVTVYYFVTNLYTKFNESNVWYARDFMVLKLSH